MTKAQEKLKDGFDRLQDAGNNPDLLGSTLLSFHGALEDHFRDVLEFTSTLPSTQRARVQDTRLVQWKELIDLMQRYHNLNARHKDWILSTNRFRQEFAHGGRFSGTRREVERYGEFVRTQMNGSGSSRPIVNQRQSASRPTAQRSINSTPYIIPHRSNVVSAKFRILPQWISANFFGFIVSIIATATLSNIAVWLRILPEKWIDREFSICLIVAVIFLGLGLAQEATITRLFGKSERWAMSTAIGALIASFFLNFISITTQHHKYYPALNPNMFCIVTMGLSIGFFQFLILRKLTKKANLWLVSSSIQAVLHVVICMILPVLWGDGFGWVLSIFVGWGVSIVASGATLIYLVRDTRSKSS